MARTMKDSGIEWIGEIPEDWKISKYKYYSDNRMGETILVEDTNTEEGVPIYSATQDDKILGYVNNPSLVLHKGDFVIPARGNSIGCVSVVKEDIATCTQTMRMSKLVAGPLGAKAIVFDTIADVSDTGKNAYKRMCHGNEGGNVLAGDGSAKWEDFKQFADGNTLKNDNGLLIPTRDYYVMAGSNHVTTPGKIYKDTLGSLFK